MSKITKPAPPVITSRSLTDYKLAKRHLNTMAKFDKMKAYMKLANKAPEVVRLSIADYADINGAIQNQSDGKRSLADVRYNGLPVLSVEKSQQMDFAL